MLCQHCGKEMYDGSTCPGCGAARKLPMSGCLAPETLYEIRSIVKPAPGGDDLSPTGRARPRGTAREIDINVPVLKAPGRKKHADSDAPVLKGPMKYAVIGVIAVSLVVCLASMAYRIIDKAPADAGLIGPQTAITAEI